MKSAVATLSFLIVTITLLSGCQNTVKGLGEDTDKNVASIRKEINSN
jgi:predicted small secreted protein